jgi:hypothetical protein
MCRTVALVAGVAIPSESDLNIGMMCSTINGISGNEKLAIRQPTQKVTRFAGAVAGRSGEG